MITLFSLQYVGAQQSKVQDKEEILNTAKE